MDKTIERLHAEPALAWKMTANLLGRDGHSPQVLQAQAEVREAPLVRDLIETCDRTHGAYKKWDGAHWVLSLLADLGYPNSDETLRPLMEDTFSAWLSPEHST